MRRLGTAVLVAVGLLIISATLQETLMMCGMLGTQLEQASLRGIIAGVGVTGLAVTFSVLFGAALIFWRERLAARWFADDEVGFDIDALALLRVGLVLLGVMIAVRSLEALATLLPDLLLSFTYSSSPADFDGGGYAPWQMSVSSVAGQVLRFVLGTLLAWFSAPLASLLLRTPGIRPKNPARRQKCPSCGAPFDPSEYREDAEACCSMCGASLPVAPNNGIERAPSALD